MIDDMFEDILDIASKVLNVTPEALRAEVQAKHQRRVEKIQRANRAYHAALSRLTEAQTSKIVTLESQGYSINKVWENRQTRNTAVMLVKRGVWDGSKGKVGTKLVMLYPDGSMTETMEKRITVKQKF